MCHIHTHTDVHRHIQTCTSMPTHKHWFMHTNMRYARIHTHAYTHKHNVHEPKHTNMHTLIRQTHRHTHTYTDTHTCIHAHTKNCSKLHMTFLHAAERWCSAAAFPWMTVGPFSLNSMSCVGLGSRSAAHCALGCLPPRPGVWCNVMTVSVIQYEWYIIQIKPSTPAGLPQYKAAGTGPGNDVYV